MTKKTKNANRLHRALDSMHRMETYRMDSIKQRLETARYQVRQLEEFLQSQEATISAFADLNVRSLSSLQRKVSQLEAELQQQKTVVARAELGSNRAKEKMRQLVRQEDEKKRDRNNEEHAARRHGMQRASLR